MNIDIKFVLLVAAFVCFAIKFAGVNTGRFDCMNGGFMFLTASLLVK